MRFAHTRLLQQARRSTGGQQQFGQGGIRVARARQNGFSSLASQKVCMEEHRFVRAVDSGVSSIPKTLAQDFRSENFPERF
jgi:hypothetical protein